MTFIVVSRETEGRGLGEGTPALIAATSPMVHLTYAEASQEARRLARSVKGRTFLVFGPMLSVRQIILPPPPMPELVEEVFELPIVNKTVSIQV